MSERAETPGMGARGRAADFAGNSWDLATGGLKTLTAKRELPPQFARRVSAASADGTPGEAALHGYAFALVILACVLVMLVSGGVVLFVMLQP